MVNRERLLKRCAKETGDFGPILEDICQLLPFRLQDSEVTHEVCKLAVIVGRTVRVSRMSSSARKSSAGGWRECATA